jgi:hypothetical protein
VFEIPKMAGKLSEVKNCASDLKSNVMVDIVSHTLEYAKLGLHLCAEDSTHA